MNMPGRKYDNGSGYRYGFNGKENDNDISKGGQDYGMRIYDTRLGRFLSVDPLTDEYPELTPYQFSGNTPIQATDLDGLEPAYHYEDSKGRLIMMPAGDNLKRKVPTEHLKYLPYITKDDGSTIRGISTLLDLIPVVGTIKGAFEGVIGYNLEGDKLSTTERLTGWAPYIGKAKKIIRIVSATEKVVDANKVVKAANKVDDVKTTKNAIVKPKNKNANDAEGEFMLYDVHAEPGKQGKLLKVGKADAERITATGDPVRMKASERKARKAGYPNATATERKKLGKTTTGKAKDAEASEVRTERANGNELPLNKEKDKKYNN